MALAHYQFTGIQNHPFCCEWFARLFYLSQVDGTWSLSQTSESLLYRGKTVRSFQMLDLDGDGIEEALVETENTATGYRRWITMHIFRLIARRLMSIAKVETLSTNDAVHTQYSRELDLVKTRAAFGNPPFFRGTVYGVGYEQFPIPRMKEESVKPVPKALE